MHRAGPLPFPFLETCLDERGFFPLFLSVMDLFSAVAGEEGGGSVGRRGERERLVTLVVWHSDGAKEEELLLPLSFLPLLFCVPSVPSSLSKRGDKKKSFLFFFVAVGIGFQKRRFAK